MIKLEFLKQSFQLVSKVATRRGHSSQSCVATASPHKKIIIPNRLLIACDPFPQPVHSSKRKDSQSVFVTMSISIQRRQQSQQQPQLSGSQKQDDAITFVSCDQHQSSLATASDQLEKKDELLDTERQLFSSKNVNGLGKLKQPKSSDNWEVDSWDPNDKIDLMCCKCCRCVIM